MEEGKESGDKIIIKNKTAILENEGSSLEYVLKVRESKTGDILHRVDRLQDYVGSCVHVKMWMYVGT